MAGAVLTTEELATELGISVPQLHRARKRGELPPPAITTRPFRWARRQVEDMLAGRWIAAAPAAATSDPIMERLNGLDIASLR